MLLTLLLYKFNWVNLEKDKPVKQSIEDILLLYKIIWFRDETHNFLIGPMLEIELLSKYNSSNLFPFILQKYNHQKVIEIYNEYFQIIHSKKKYIEEKCSLLKICHNII